MKSVTLITVAVIAGGMLLTSCSYKSNSSFNQQSSNAQAGVQTAAPLPTARPDLQPAATQANSPVNDPKLLQAADEADQALNDLNKSLQSDDTMNDLAASIAPANGSARDAYNTTDQTLNDLTQNILSVPTPAVP